MSNKSMEEQSKTRIASREMADEMCRPASNAATTLARVSAEEERQHQQDVVVMADMIRIAKENENLRAEVAAVRALAKLPEQYCLACGGTGGHWEGCHGTTGLMAMQSENAQLRAEVAELRAWKESAMQIEATWDEQKVGHLLGLKLGSAIRPQILPAIAQLRADLERARQVLFLVQLHFQRNESSGNFQGDDEHECWTAVNCALAQHQ